MKNFALLALAIAACLTACGKQTADEDVTAAGSPAEEAPTFDELVPEAIVFDRAFVDHMHMHADRMDELMFALSDGDLVAASTAAYWLARHPADDRIPDDWLPHLESMREAARDVERADDLETASAAAERITVHCQGCHAAAGVDSID